MSDWEELSDDGLVARLVQHVGMPGYIARDWVEWREVPSGKAQIDRFLAKDPDGQP